MKKFALLLIAMAAVSACGSDESILQLDNQSSYAIYEVNLSPTDSLSWGADLLGADVLNPGDILELSEIDCDFYDVRLVDEDGDECVLEDIDLCGDNERWVITDGALALCQLFN